MVYRGNSNSDTTLGSDPEALYRYRNLWLKGKKAHWGIERAATGNHRAEGLGSKMDLSAQLLALSGALVVTPQRRTVLASLG